MKISRFLIALLSGLALSTAVLAARDGRGAGCAMRGGTPAKTASAAQATLYTCPMHPDVTSDKPGKCPKCGMTLVPVKAPAAAKAYVCEMDGFVSDKPGKCPKCGMVLKEVDKADITYRCPMDKDVVSDKPGKCPKCGMTLAMHVESAPAQPPSPKAKGH